MKKLLGFDSWTQGANNYKRLVQELNLSGYQLILVHLGSWGHDERPFNEEIDGDLIIRDIKFYKGKSFLEVLKSEKPDAVIFLSTTAFAHRAFNRYCKLLNIPTVHLYHGLIAVQAIDGDRLNPVNWKSQIILLFQRAWVNIVRIFPTYMRSLCKSKASLNDWYWFLKDIFSKIIATSYSGLAAPDSSTTVICVYVDSDIVHAIERYGARREHVFVLGNPDLINFSLANEHIGSRVEGNGLFYKDIVYIDNGLVDIGAIFDSVEDYSIHILKTRDEIERLGLNFSIKLHPIHFRTGLIDILLSENIEILSNDNFIDKLLNSRACIVEPTSAAVIPALIGVPIFLAQFGKLNQQEYGNVLTSYPKAFHLRELNQFGNLLKAVNDDYELKDTNDWILRNVGPLPPAYFAKRFVNALEYSINISLK